MHKYKVIDEDDKAHYIAAEDDIDAIAKFDHKSPYKAAKRVELVEADAYKKK